MMRTNRLSRRRFTALAATTAVSVSLAGCTGSGGNSPAEESGDTPDTSTQNTETPESSSGDETGGTSGSVSFDGWLDEVGNYDRVVDETGTSAVSVDVGSEANGGGFGFGPAAVRVSKGTTVTWEWTGNGGSHNVVDTDGNFESELATSAGHTFEHTFGETGTFKYSCVPHETIGMKGVVVVE